MPQSTYSLSVGGDGDYISVPLPAVASGDDFCLSFWVWRDGSAAGGFQALFDDATGGREWSSFHNSTGAMTFNGSIYANTGAWAADTWVHIAIRRESGTMKCYVDGTETDSAANSNAHSALDLRFGDNSSGGGSNWLGGYDDIAWWLGSIPSVMNMADIANGSLDAATLSPDRHWRIEEGTGTTLDDTGADAQDASLSGATWDTDVPDPLGGGAAAPVGPVLFGRLISPGRIFGGSAIAC